MSDIALVSHMPSSGIATDAHTLDLQPHAALFCAIPPIRWRLALYRAMSTLTSAAPIGPGGQLQLHLALAAPSC